MYLLNQIALCPKGFDDVQLFAERDASIRRPAPTASSPGLGSPAWIWKILVTESKMTCDRICLINH